MQNDAFNTQCVADCLTWHQSCNIGAVIYWVSLDPMIARHDCMTAEEKAAILQDRVHPVEARAAPL